MNTVRLQYTQVDGIYSQQRSMTAVSYTQSYRGYRCLREGRNSERSRHFTVLEGKQLLQQVENFGKNNLSGKGEGAEDTASA